MCWRKHLAVPFSLFSSRQTHKQGVLLTTSVANTPHSFLQPDWSIQMYSARTNERRSWETPMQIAYYVTATDSDEPPPPTSSLFPVPLICLPSATVFARWDFPIKLWLIPWRTVGTCTPACLQRKRKKSRGCARERVRKRRGARERDGNRGARHREEREEEERKGDAGGTREAGEDRWTGCREIDVNLISVVERGGSG